ncbi:Yqey-like protein-domain-containing protein [Mycena epipterygia]|nr:Yqey-like protein-domain-containing protein [Mycena epipterygia]
MATSSIRSLCRATTLRLYRSYSVVQSTPDVRAELVAAVKAAMKSKDTVSSTTLRGVLAEVYSADKAINTQVASSTIISILRKAALRRTEAAAQYAAARPDLAEKEILEANLISRFLPPLLSETDIDIQLKKILNDLPKDSQKPGNIFKMFYSVVDKSTVDSDMVKKRLNALLNVI